MELIPYPIGPLNPKVQDVGYALALFAFIYVCVTRLLPRMNRALELRDDAINGTKERAEAVRLFMNKHGVPLNRMATISYGEEDPVAPNDNPDGRAQNRRVVIQVLA